MIESLRGDAELAVAAGEDVVSKYADVPEVVPV